MLTESATQALSILRDASLFQWYVIPLFALVVYVYSVEIERRNWNLVFAGLAFWGMDWINEIWNSLVLHFSGYAPMWGAPADTALLILVGLNIEIMFMFAIAGIAFGKMLPPDPKQKILGIPNRIFFAITSTSPVGIFGFFAPSGRGCTSPSTWRVNSGRISATAAWASASASLLTRIWVRP